MKQFYVFCLLSFLTLKAIAWNGTGTENDPYLISSPEDMVALSESTLSHEGEYFKMTADIDMAGVDNFRAIGTANNIFKGNFNGQNFQIHNLVVSLGAYGNEKIALFGHVEEGVIENVHIRGASRFEGIKYVASVVAYISNGTLRNCSSTAFVTGPDKYSQYIGGITAFATGTPVTNCYNMGAVTAPGTNSSHVAGVAGAIVSGSEISDCYNLGLISGGSYVGGIAGLIGNDEIIKNCYNKGFVVGTEDYTGGVAGSVNSGLITDGDMYTCYNTGKITGKNYVGGVVGETTITHHSCNIGTVEASGQFAGGVAGAGGVYNCYNKASVKGVKAVGGVVGNDWDVNNCYNTGAVVGQDRVGGIAGEITGTTDHKIYNSYNVSSVAIEGSNTSIGGVAGYVNSGGLVNSNEIKNTYWNKDTYSGTGVGGWSDDVSGRFLYYSKTSSELRNNFHTTLGAAWGPDSQNINDGYPVLGGEISLLSPVANPVYNITATAGDHGSINPSGSTEAVAGSAVFYTIVPEEGWVVHKITVDGIDKGNSTLFNLEDISGNHIVHVTFRDPLNNIEDAVKDNISCRLISGQLYIENASPSQLNVFDLAGRQILARELKSNHETINVDFLQNGLYIINIYKDGKSKSFKIVK